MPRRLHRKTYHSIHECMEDLLAREDLGRINRLGLWTAFGSVDQVKRFAAMPRDERRAFFDRYERSLADDAQPHQEDPDSRLFDLPPFATVEQIHQRYRQLALAFHPDRQGDLQTMQEVNSAYQRLLARAQARDASDN